MKYIFLIPLMILSLVNRSEALVDIIDMKEGLHSADAKAYAFSLYTDYAKFNYVLKRIESGNSEWIKVGKLLEQYTDAGVSTELAISFAKAIQNNPGYALSVMTDHEIQWSCSVPLLEPAKDEFDLFVENTINALENLDDAELQEKKKKMLHGNATRTAMLEK